MIFPPISGSITWIRNCPWLRWRIIFNLNGDTYFKVRRPGHNLDRARNQFKLVGSIEEQFEEMRKLFKR